MAQLPVVLRAGTTLQVSKAVCCVPAVIMCELWHVAATCLSKSSLALVPGEY